MQAGSIPPFTFPGEVASHVVGPEVTRPASAAERPTSSTQPKQPALARHNKAVSFKPRPFRRHPLGLHELAPPCTAVPEDNDVQFSEHDGGSGGGKHSLAAVRPAEYEFLDSGHSSDGGEGGRQSRSRLLPVQPRHSDVLGSPVVSIATSDTSTVMWLDRPSANHGEHAVRRLTQDAASSRPSEDCTGHERVTQQQLAEQLYISRVRARRQSLIAPVGSCAVSEVVAEAEAPAPSGGRPRSILVWPRHLWLREWVLILATALILVDQLSNGWLLLYFYLDAQYGWLTITVAYSGASWIVQGLFVSLEEWLDPWARSPFTKFWIGFFRLHIPWSTGLCLRAMIERNLAKDRLSHDRRSSASSLALHASKPSPLSARVVDMFPEDATASVEPAPPHGRKDIQDVLESVLWQDAREYHLVRAAQAFLNEGTGRRLVESGAWLRLVQCIFESLPGLMFHFYITILSREASVVRVLAMVTAMLSMSVNLAIFCTEDQPVLRKVAIFAHVCSQIAMRTTAMAWLAVSQADKSLPIFVLFAIIALVFSTYFYSSLGVAIANLFAVPLFFLAWDTTRAHNADLFGWKTSDHGLDVSRTRVVRFLVLWRLIENTLSVMVVFYAAPLYPCTSSRPDVRYLSLYCMACCRGPVQYTELCASTAVAGVAYVTSWVAGWWLDNYFYNQVVSDAELDESKLEVIIGGTPWSKRTRSARPSEPLTAPKDAWGEQGSGVAETDRR